LAWVGGSWVALGGGGSCGRGVAVVGVCLLSLMCEAWIRSSALRKRRGCEVGGMEPQGRGSGRLLKSEAEAGERELFRGAWDASFVTERSAGVLGMRCAVSELLVCALFAAS